MADMIKTPASTSQARQRARWEVPTLLRFAAGCAQSGSGTGGDGASQIS